MTSIVRGLLGKESSAEKVLGRFTPAGFAAPGLRGSFDKESNIFGVRRTGEGERALTELRGGFEELAGEIGGLREDVRPGFGRLTRSRIEAIRGAGQRAVGNLREELGKRRVLGSTFATREVASTEAEFGRMEEEARAESFLQELDLTRQLIGEQFQASISGAAAVLNQLNFETGLAAQLGDSASRQMQSTNIAMAEARHAQEQSANEFLATVIGAFAGGGTSAPAAVSKPGIGGI